MFSSCKKDEDVKGCYLFSITEVWTAYPPVEGFQTIRNTATQTKCELTAKGAKEYSDSIETTKINSDMGLKIVITCTYKKQ